MLYRIGFFGLITALLAGCIVEGRIWRHHPGGDGGGAGAGGGTDENSGTGGGGGAGGATGEADAGAPSCDALASCDDYSTGCGGCAVRGECAEPYASCDDSCVQFEKCLDSCGADNVACQKSCYDDNPSGAERYNALISCIVCQACPNSCAMFKSTVCSP